MQLQLKALGLALALVASAARAESDQEQIKKLFSKYDQVVSEHKVQLVPEVFSPKFLTDAGGEKQFASIVRSEKLTLRPYSLEIKPGRLDKNLVFVKRIPTDAKQKSDSSFIVKRNPSGEWRIDGTVGDEE